MSKRLDNAYRNYVKRYKQKSRSMARRGYTMESAMMGKRMYIAARAAYIREEGITTNINQTIVSDQQFKYSYNTARALKRSAEEYNLPFKGEGILELRKGYSVSKDNPTFTAFLSELNNKLKEQHQDWTSKDRGNYISHEIFGSE